MRCRFVDSMQAIDAASWNTLLPDDSPLLSHAFLALLEDSGSVNAERGWQPQHLLLEENGVLLAAMPLYVKTHSYGEYVFDHSWAQAYQRHRLPYYPKLLSAVPFTPATGTRLLLHKSADSASVIALLCHLLRKHCQETGASGWHILFPDNAEAPAWQQQGAALRLGCQFHWHNKHYTDFDDFLATFASRKRKEVKRERRRVAEQGVSLQRVVGEDISATDWQDFYRFYVHTNLKYNGHGGYLTPAFFTGLYNNRQLRERLLLVMARDETGHAIAGALNVFSATTLYGRYWGALRDVECLHFETCYYQGIEFCIEKGLARFDPGAQGEHKIARGFAPTLTHSLHWLAHDGFRQAVHEFVREEAQAVQQYRNEMCRALPFRAPDP